MSPPQNLLAPLPLPLPVPVPLPFTRERLDKSTKGQSSALFAPSDVSVKLDLEPTPMVTQGPIRSRRESLPSNSKAPNNMAQLQATNRPIYRSGKRSVTDSAVVVPQTNTAATTHTHHRVSNDAHQMATGSGPGSKGQEQRKRFGSIAAVFSRVLGDKTSPS